MRPGQLEPNEFELAILSRLGNQEPWLPALLDRLHVLSREFTGVGSFTRFRCDVSDSVTHQRRVDLEAIIRMPTVPNSMGAVLFCTGEHPECLEVYTYGDDHWDGLFSGFSIEKGAGGDETRIHP